MDEDEDDGRTVEERGGQGGSEEDNNEGCLPLAPRDYNSDNSDDDDGDGEEEYNTGVNGVGAAEGTTDGDMKDMTEEELLLTKPGGKLQHNEDTVDNKMCQVYRNVVRQGNGIDQDGGIRDDDVWQEMW